MADQDRSQRTEKATPRRLEDARREGNSPRTRELPAAMILAVFFVFCKIFGPSWMDQMRSVLTGTLGHLWVGELTPDQWLAVCRNVGLVATKLLMLPVGLIAVASLGGNMLQEPVRFSAKALRIDFSRVNPIKGLSKVFSAQSLMQLLKAAIKSVLFSVVAALAVRDAFRHGLAGGPGAQGAMQAIFSLAGTVIFRVALLWFVLALLDRMWTVFDWKRNLKMTKQEIKEEHRQEEGDPHVRNRIRSKQYEAVRSRMMTDVPRATVVVTNPTHVAVALRYVPGESDVPLVLAKGRNLIAQRIKEIAREHAVPIVEDPPLARALERSVPVGGHIPPALFRAVAEILALVLRGRRRDPRPDADGVRP